MTKRATKDEMFENSLRMAAEWGFRAAEKGWNLQQTMLRFEEFLKADNNDNCVAVAASIESR